MNRIASPRAIAALGLGLVMAMSAAIQAGSAQTEPRSLPNLQNQDRGPDPQPDRQFDRRDDRQSDRQSDRRDGRGFVERRLTDLHAQLRIAPAQERAWLAFAGAVRDDARDRLRDRAGDRDQRRGPPGVVERLEDREKDLADRSAGLDRIVRALRPLYASFTDEQKRTADREMFQLADGPFAGPGPGRERPDPRDNRGDRDNRDNR